MTQDDRFFTSREQPEAAGLSATLQHISGWPVLSITDSPQTLELKLVNRTPHPVTAGPATLRLLFRPGVLMALNKLALAPQSDAQWVLVVEDTKPEEEGSILLAGVEPFTLASGQSCTIRIDGVSAAPQGGSRATRVEVAYSDFFHEGGGEVAGTRLIHMPVLRRHEPVGRPIKEIRTGSISVSGPFTAGFTEGGDILNNGESPNRLVLRIANTSRFPVAWSHLGDEATRFYLSFRKGTQGTEWGILSSDGDHLGVESILDYKASDENAKPQSGWQIDNHTLRRNTPGALAPGDYVEIVLQVHSKALTGQAQLVLTYENLPQHDDGDLVLLADLGSIADRPHAVEIIKPVHIAGDLDVGGKVHFGGALNTDNPYVAITADAFRLGGSLSRYYAVVISNDAAENGPLQMEVFRADANADATGRGALIAEISCYGAKGSQAPFWNLRVRQSGSMFIGGFEKAPDAINTLVETAANKDAKEPISADVHVLWLKGATTYAWRSSGPARLVDKDSFGKGTPLPVGSKFKSKSTPDPGFKASDIEISKTGTEPALTPVPSGAIIMWSGDTKNIPYGWALCDGTNGTPDLTDRFIMGRGAGTRGTKGDGDTHKHMIDPPTTRTSKDGAHTHKFPSDWYKRNFDDGGYSGIDTSGDNVKSKTTESAGDHNHTVNIRSFYSSETGVLRPRWYALCFIMKLGTRRTD